MTVRQPGLAAKVPMPTRKGRDAAHQEQPRLPCRAGIFGFARRFSFRASWPFPPCGEDLL